MAKPRKTKGRPALPEKERRLKPMGFRPDPEVRRRIVEAAKESGRALSQEIEARLHRTFEADQQVGGPELWALFKMMAAAAELIEHRTEQSWTTDAASARAVQISWDRIIEEFLPNIVPKDVMTDIRNFNQNRQVLEELTLQVIEKTKPYDGNFILRTVLDSLETNEEAKTEIHVAVREFTTKLLENRYGQENTNRATEDAVALLKTKKEELQDLDKKSTAIDESLSETRGRLKPLDTFLTSTRTLGEHVAERLLPPRKTDEEME